MQHDRVLSKLGNLNIYIYIYIYEAKTKANGRSDPTLYVFSPIGAATHAGQKRRGVYAMVQVLTSGLRTHPIEESRAATVSSCLLSAFAQSPTATVETSTGPSSDCFCHPRTAWDQRAEDPPAATPATPAWQCNAPLSTTPRS